MSTDTLIPPTTASWQTPPAPHGQSERLDHLADGTWHLVRLLGGRPLGQRTITPNEAAVWLVVAGQLADADPPAVLADEVAALEI